VALGEVEGEGVDRDHHVHFETAVLIAQQREYVALEPLAWKAAHIEGLCIKFDGRLTRRTDGLAQRIVQGDIRWQIGIDRVQYHDAPRPGSAFRTLRQRDRGAGRQRERDEESEDVRADPCFRSMQLHPRFQRTPPLRQRGESIAGCLRLPARRSVGRQRRAHGLDQFATRKGLDQKVRGAERFGLGVHCGQIVCRDEDDRRMDSTPSKPATEREP